MWFFFCEVETEYLSCCDKIEITKTNFLSQCLIFWYTFASHESISVTLTSQNTIKNFKNITRYHFKEGMKYYSEHELTSSHSQNNSLWNLFLRFLSPLKIFSSRKYGNVFLNLRSYKKVPSFLLYYVFFAVQSESEIRFLRSNLWIFFLIKYPKWYNNS